MIDATPIYTDEVLRLINMKDEMIYAKDISPVIHIKPDTIIRYVKTGTWDADRLGNFIESGRCVKFYRIDFLRKGGWIQ